MSEPGFAELRDHLARSWPATERVVRDGWLLRATPAVPRGRLNSALPLTVDPDPAVVEAFYAERGLPPQVQVTPVGGHPRLVAELDARGWSSRWTALVMAAPAERVAAGIDRRGGLAAAVVGALAAWGIERGATWLCLEVAERNEAAVPLYERLGFTRRYAYLHRVARATTFYR